MYTLMQRKGILYAYRFAQSNHVFIGTQSLDILYILVLLEEDSIDFVLLKTPSIIGSLSLVHTVKTSSFCVVCHRNLFRTKIVGDFCSK